MDTDSAAIVRARDVMQKKIISIDGMATAKEASVKMRSEKVYSLLVNKRNADDAWGPGRPLTIGSLAAALGAQAVLLRGALAGGCGFAECHGGEIIGQDLWLVKGDVQKYIMIGRFWYIVFRGGGSYEGSLMGVGSFSQMWGGQGRRAALKRAGEISPGL